ncbi:helix-turn-helix transcriptional regulator [Hymenobacter sp. HSC-4F20]|uniref:helix-turn-helix domain-containing protein n=1 Tax=Hymenobacter sp. HSC-4F20 TaxID=2864135 RepID=UPI001C736B21|nr:AraC family transcriptional regulator [Hymenobacter sp. HSC-4F20]MBX0290589.1 helix-turn-helix transcriptional regulator [Hymenobacter sp. HSC-4F20]
MMAPTQTLPDFYATKLQQPLPDLRRGDGHFAVFRLEDFPTSTDLAAVYGRKDFYKIMLGTGHATYHYGAQQALLAPGQHALVFTNAQVPYSWELHGLPYTGYCCVFTEDFLPAHTRLQPTNLAVFHAQGQPFFYLDTAQAAAFGALFEKMLAEQASDYAQKYELLFYYVMECVHGALKLAPAASAVLVGSRLVAAFRTLLAQQFPIVSPSQRLELHTAQAFADRLAVHVNSLNRTLKAATGNTTSQLLAQRLVQEARALLRHTDWPIGQIGYCLGFDEQTHFTHFFKRHAQCTPTQARQV